ncbi:helix-hairpin-helix domain-containing protein [uncultured Desulfovibrio sp.]|uniref:ComEA family DNA-binding protein n=1 Tax=uncultured Desulfovibrio sp. TaxID=167968 RepID=UPI0026137104|nr:helix-hairpin-helix domain-containing protein [uncultured Desulfovibrio sp.]
MKTIIRGVLLSMMLVAPTLVLATAEVQAVPTDRKEVEHRLELNNITAEELAATGAVDLATAKKIVQLREDLGGFQSYDDLKELNIPDEQFKQLQYNTTIKGIAADCNC